MSTIIKVKSYQLTKEELVGLNTAFKVLEIAYSNASGEMKNAVGLAAEMVGNVVSRTIEEVDPLEAERAKLKAQIEEAQRKLAAIGG